MNIAVCEDDAQDREAICSYVKEYGHKYCYTINVSAFDSAENLLSALERESFRIIFLDIYLPGLSGVETARKIRESDADCVIVFITSSTDYALDGYNVEALSYVVKPLDANKMDKVFAVCRRVFEEYSRYIEVMADYQIVKVPLNQLMYAEVYGKAVLLYLPRKVIKTYTPMSKIEKMLEYPPFLRCHRCFLVNLNYVEDMGERDFLMKNGVRIPIRKNGRTEVRLATASFMCL